MDDKQTHSHYGVGCLFWLCSWCRVKKNMAKFLFFPVPVTISIGKECNSEKSRYSYNKVIQREGASLHLLYNN